MPCTFPAPNKHTQPASPPSDRPAFSERPPKVSPRPAILCDLRSGTPQSAPPARQDHRHHLSQPLRAVYPRTRPWLPTVRRPSRPLRLSLQPSPPCRATSTARRRARHTNTSSNSRSRSVDNGATPSESRADTAPRRRKHGPRTLRYCSRPTPPWRPSCSLRPHSRER